MPKMKKNETMDDRVSDPDPDSDSDSDSQKNIACDTATELDEIADSLITSMPDVQEHAIAAEEQKQREMIEQYSQYTDNQGVPFDPGIHKTKSDGTPTISKSGNLMRKPVSKLKINTKTRGENENDLKQKQVANALGKTTANLVFAICTGVMGEEWVPRRDPETGIDERTYMESVWSQYYEATGKTDLPPNMIVAAGIMAYIAPRLSMPKTRARSATLWEKFKLWRKAKSIEAEEKKQRDIPKRPGSTGEKERRAQ